MTCVQHGEPAAGVPRAAAHADPSHATCGQQAAHQRVARCRGKRGVERVAWIRRGSGRWRRQKHVQQRVNGLCARARWWHLERQQAPHNRWTRANVAVRARAVAAVTARFAQGGVWLFGTPGASILRAVCVRRLTSSVRACLCPPALDSVIKARPEHRSSNSSRTGTLRSRTCRRCPSRSSSGLRTSTTRRRPTRRR